MNVSLELLAVGVIMSLMFSFILLKGIIKGAAGFALIAIGFFFIILSFDPLHDMVLLWILSMDVGVICAGLSKNVLPRLWLLVGLLGVFLTFILLMIRTGFMG